jgi:hypothetical protein
MCMFSVCFKKTSDSTLEDRAPNVLDNYPEHWAGDGSPIFQHAIRSFLTTHTHTHTHIAHLTQKHNITKQTHIAYLTQKHKPTNYF